MVSRKPDKTDVINSISIEMDDMFWRLEKLYGRPAFEELLPVLTEVEARLTECLLDYAPPEIPN